MKRVVTYVLLTATMTAIIVELFGVIVFAPESWQTRPWTVWERCAQVVFPVLGWPVVAGTLLLGSIGMNLPDCVTKPLVVLMFLASGAFWAVVIQMVGRSIRKRMTPNQDSEATLESASDAVSSSPQGHRGKHEEVV